MRLVPTTFYFDLSDVGSYLAAAQLPAFIREFPVSIELCPVDANALASRNGSPVRALSGPASAYRRDDAERWARRMEIPLVFPEEPISQGLAMRVAQWIIENAPEDALTATLGLFERVWSTGLVVGPAEIRECLDEIGLGAEAALQAANAADAFRGLDLAIERAHTQGVFAVPTLRIDGRHYVGFDRFDFAAQGIIERAILDAPIEQLAPIFAELIASQSDQRRQDILSALTAPSEEEAGDETALDAADSRFDLLSATIRMLPQQEVQHRIPASPAAGPIHLRVFPLGRDDEHWAEAESLCKLVWGPGTAVFGPASLIINDISLLRRRLRDEKQQKTGGLLGPALVAGVDSIINIAPRLDDRAAPIHLAASSPGPSSDGELVSHIVGGGRAACLSRELALDPVAHRKASAAGAHVLILMTTEDVSVIARASAIRCQRYVVTIGDKLSVYTPRGAVLDQEWPGEGPITLQLPWPPNGDLGEIPRTSPPRTMLVNEEPVSVGSLESSADIGFSVTGNGLLVSTAGVRSMLSSNRRFESVRRPNGPILILPTHGNSILAAELVLQRVLNTLSRCPRDSRLLLVNYWAELEYERLELLHPVLAATAVELSTPVLLAVGARPVDLWVPDATNRTAYRVEADGEEFPLDLAQQPNVPLRKSQLIHQMGPSPERYLQMLQTMAVRT